MEQVNSELYLKNLYIMQENERLRKQAELLEQENKQMLFELRKKKLSKGGNNTTPKSGINSSSSSKTPNPKN